MKEKLLQSIDKSFDWLLKHLDNFIIPEYNVNISEGVTDEKKAFGELALVLLIVIKSPKFSNDSRINKIKDYVHKLALSKNFVFNMQSDISLFPFYLTVYVSLKEVGIELDTHNAILENLLRYNYITQVERTAWQLIDLKYFLDKGGFENELPDNKTLYR